MTKDKYFNLCEQMGEEPNPDKIPPGIEDFPLDVQKAMVIFNKLGDKVQADIGYLGKDYTAVPMYMNVHEVENKLIFLETIARLDAAVIEKSATEMKAERKKLERARNA
jgi:hypothetical protein